ncbi:type IV secretion system protein [Arthrobacter sp. H14-L1]|nr:type IV secretion system protein [Arthrobacter sp. H14-L1]
MSAAQDTIGSAITGFFAGILESIASWLWSFISGAFGVSNVDDSQWNAVQGLTGWWVIVMMTPLVVIMILQLISGLISQQPRRIGRALIGGFIAVPLVGGAVYLMQALTHVSDSASTAVLNTMGSDPYVVFMRLFGFHRGPAGSGQAWIPAPMIAQAATENPVSGSILITVLATLIIWVLAFILMCSMIFRSFALIVLAAVAPVALMLIPWEKTKSWAGRWCEIAVALLLAKPLAATILAVAVKLYANATSFAGMAAGAVGMTLACAAPLIALKLVGFAGGELAAAAQSAGGAHIAQKGSNFAGRQIGQQLRNHHMLRAGSMGRSPGVVKSSGKPETANVKKTETPSPGSAPSPDQAMVQQGAAATTKTSAPAAKASAPEPAATAQEMGHPSKAAPPSSDPGMSSPGMHSTGVPNPGVPGHGARPGSPGPIPGPKPTPPAPKPGPPPIRPPQSGEHHD